MYMWFAQTLTFNIISWQLGLFWTSRELSGVVHCQGGDYQNHLTEPHSGSSETLLVTSQRAWSSMIPERLEAGFAAYLMLTVLDWAGQQTHEFLGLSRYFVFGNSAAF